MRKKSNYTGGLNSVHKRGFPGLILFLCGFLLGNLLPNVFWRMDLRRKTMSSLYLLGTFADKKISGTEYLKEILRMRGSVYFLCAVCGFSVFGVPLAVVGTILFGMGMGTLLAMSVLEFGFQGGMVGLALLFPQYLLYVPITLHLMDWVYELSMDSWRSKGLFPGKIGSYGITVLLGAGGYLGGILLECYVNPRVIEKIIELLKIF